MQFHLTYAGELLAEPTNRRPGARADLKQAIRKAFHPQLRSVWNTHRFTPETRDDLANRFTRFGYRFVPLATKALTLHCSLDILLLRPEGPGVIYAGDLDNRLKTLIDGLRMPSELEVGKYTAPDAD